MSDDILNAITPTERLRTRRLAADLLDCTLEARNAAGDWLTVASATVRGDDRLQMAGDAAVARAYNRLLFNSELIRQGAFTADYLQLLESAVTEKGLHHG